MNRKIFGVLMAVIALAINSLASAAEHTKDTPAEVKKAIDDKKAMLVDVREIEEWKDGHLKDAKLVPLSDLKAGLTAEKLESLVPTGKVVYLHCASGKRCLTAAAYFKKLGYDARPLKEGYNDLVKAGLPKAE